MSDLGLALLGSGVVVPTPPPMRAVMARAAAAGLRDCGMGGEEHAVQTRTHAQRATCNIRRATCNITPCSMQHTLCNVQHTPCNVGCCVASNIK